MAPALPRPRQVTIAGWTIMAGSVAIVLTVFQLVAGLHSIDTQDAVQNVLGEPPFDSTGLTVDQVLAVIRVLAMVAAACATATAVLGWQVLQRAKSARIALSLLAVPLFLTGLSTGGVFSTLVALAVVLLWLQPARDWFDGRWKPEPVQPPTPPRTPARRPDPLAPRSPAEQPWGQQPQQPPPYSGWPPVQQPQPPSAPPARAADHDWPPPSAPMPFGPPAPAPAGTARPAGAAAGPATGRPRAVLAAAVVTWVCAVLMGGFFVAGAVWLTASPDTLMDEMTRQDPELVADGTITVDVLRTTLVVLAALVVVWVTVACVAAFFVLRRASWARAVLLVCAGAAGVALLLTTLVNVGMLVPLAGAVVVVVLLLRRDVSAWFSRR